eukprot:NODE_295_length_1952_cov_59.615344_g246_i0.p2 GENE.NODE_295_length_1952_cov_59.615344_g246_i0~~NODE_295_length_1952_cov_59.615344_g246_i0.p2  ORF type:complete len:493 (-),score=139.37 NODE_295_length_1952_cov_59.615344_g246_i0:131-1609(-)
MLKISATHSNAQWPRPQPSVYEGYPFHALIVTRGTRGDVQPFIALARGLAEMKGWMVTICTEMSFKEFVKQNANVQRGCIRFRPSGGNTAARIDTRLAKWAMQSKSELMQATMLARSEAEFFDSEPALMHWAAMMRPQVIIFGFTMASLAHMASEYLRIPILGFVLQPTCLPSETYPAIVPIDTHFLPGLDRLEALSTSHEVQKALKGLMESNPLQETLNTKRRRWGLDPLQHGSIWEVLQYTNIPIVVPIQEQCFGGKPRDWGPRTMLTDFIFLRKGGVPKLEDRVERFLSNAKAAGRPVVVMAFSSMPVSRSDIMEIACTIATKARSRPCVMALVGSQGDEHLGKSHTTKINKLKDEGSLLEEKGAPFGELFPRVDFVIIHGGLGTTAEALRAGIPCMATGVLLMDQRFWGRRIAELNVGPEPVHIHSFLQHCVPICDQALNKHGVWATEARGLAARIQGKSEDGVKENVDAIVELLSRSIKNFDHRPLY